MWLWSKPWTLQLKFLLFNFYLEASTRRYLTALASVSGPLSGMIGFVTINLPSMGYYWPPFLHREGRPASWESNQSASSGRSISSLLFQCHIIFFFISQTVENHNTMDDLTSLQQICMQISVLTRVLMRSWNSVVSRLL